MKLLKNLRIRVLSWLLTRAIMDGFTYLRDQKLGVRVNAAMDKRLGMRSESIQDEVGKWLIQLGQDIQA